MRNLAFLAVCFITLAFGSGAFASDTTQKTGEINNTASTEKSFFMEAGNVVDEIFSAPFASLKRNSCNWATAKSSAPATVAATGANSVKETAFAPTIVYDTTHASGQGAEITSAANGPATQMSDSVTLAGTNRAVTNITIRVFTITSTAPFNLTMKLYTDCTTGGAANSPCGSGAGVLIPNSTVTVSNIVPPAVGTTIPVSFTFPNTNLTSETDNTISVSLLSSRSDVFWILGETPVVGTSTDVLERCGSAGTNNGCARNFGVPNNFDMTITADTVSTAAGVTVSGRVMMPTGKALSRATVIMTDRAGVARSVSTDRRGGFIFADVQAGESYIFEVRSKLYTFNSQVITVTEDLDGVNFTANN